MSFSLKNTFRKIKNAIASKRLWTELPPLAYRGCPTRAVVFLISVQVDTNLIYTRYECSQKSFVLALHLNIQIEESQNLYFGYVIIRNEYMILMIWFANQNIVINHAMCVRSNLKFTETICWSQCSLHLLHIYWESFHWEPCPGVTWT